MNLKAFYTIERDGFTDCDGDRVTPSLPASPSQNMKCLPGMIPSVCAMLVWVAWGQAPPPSSMIRALGDVTAVDAGAKTIQLKSDAGVTWSVALTDKTMCVSIAPGETDLKKATPITLDAIKPGDRVRARGELGSDVNTMTALSVIVMTKTDLAQKHARDRAEWMSRSVAGTVTAVDPGANEITISTRSREGQKTTVIQASASTQYRRYASDSVKFADAKPSSLAEIQVGDQVRALGDKNDDGTRVTAEEVMSGAFRTFAGTVISVDPAAGTLRVTDLQTNKPVTVRVKEDTLVRRLPEMMAMILARRIGGGTSGPGGASGPGGPGQGGAPGGASGGGGQWQRGGQGNGAGPDGAGGPGGLGGRQFDLQQILERMPPLNLADLKKGDALLISSSRGSDPTAVTALTLLAGAEPLLAAAPRMAGGSFNAGSWNLDIGMPGMPTE